MYSFKAYWRKFCPTANREIARSMWNDYREVAMVSTDYVAKDHEDMFNYPEVAVVTGYIKAGTSFTLAPLQAATPCNVAECNDGCYNIPKAKGNNPMYIENDKKLEASKINYLNERISIVAYQKNDDLPKTFGLTDDIVPQTPNEMVKRIQDGKFLLNKETEDKKVYDPVRYIRWRDPAVVEDKAGYEAAVKSLHTASQDARDSVALFTDIDPKTALDAVKTLEAWTPTMLAS